MTSSEDVIVLVNLTNSVWPSINFNGSPSYINTSTSGFLCSNQNFDQMEYFLNGVSTAVVIAMGAVGNLMAMIVLTRRTMHTSTNCFLSALAIWDTLVLLICLLLVAMPELSLAFKMHVFPYIVVYAYPLALSAQTATVWLTVSFTVERYIAVCHPLQAARMCNIPRARMVIVVISAVAVLYNVPRWLEYTIHQARDAQNQTCVIPKSTPLAIDPIYHKIYFGWLYFLVMCFIPLCTLAVLNAFLIVAVRRSQRQRKDMNVRQSRENNVTIMLVSVVMVFIICQVPALIYNMAYAINMPKVKSSVGWNVLSNFRNFLVTLNSAINFILYCTLGQKFRRTFVRTLCPCIAQKMPNRFQSFSFHPRAENGFQKTINGDYSKVGYKPCRTESQNENRTNINLDMKVIRPKFNSRESTESFESAESPDAFISNPYTRSHKRLLGPSSNGK